jgi:LuxR family maltose regulon positive regulatory protein
MESDFGWMRHLSDETLGRLLKELSDKLHSDVCNRIVDVLQARREIEGSLRAGSANDQTSFKVPPPNYRVRIGSLGVFRLWRGSTEVEEHEWGGFSAKRLLFRLLVARGRFIFREQLQQELWPNAERSVAQTMLRVTLSRLNRILEPTKQKGAPGHFVCARNGTLAFDMNSFHSWDVTEWLESVRAAECMRSEKGDRAALAAYRRAFDGYRGSFMPEARDDAWVTLFRTNLSERFLQLGHTTVELIQKFGTIEEVIEIASRLLEEDRADEVAWTMLAKANLLKGDRCAALRAYFQASDALRAVLDIEPSGELADLASRIRVIHRQDQLK